jgi:hypothetical protein
VFCAAFLTRSADDAAGKAKDGKGAATLQVRYGHVIMAKLPGYPNWPAKVRVVVGSICQCRLRFAFGISLCIRPMSTILSS